MVSMVTQYWVQASTVAPVHVQDTLTADTPMELPVTQTMPPTRSSASVVTDMQVLAVIAAPLGTMGFLSSLAGCAGRASATGTLTPRTQSHVTHKPANASGACITQTATHVLSVNQVIMEMHSLRTVGAVLV